MISSETLTGADMEWGAWRVAWRADMDIIFERLLGMLTRDTRRLEGVVRSKSLTIG
jgi:hypothetical protein